MGRRELAESGSEESAAQEKSSSDEEEEECGNPREGQEQSQQAITEYEKQRLSRIAENRARMKALGLSKMASSLMGSSQGSSKLKGKRKIMEEDEDYRPNDDDECDVDDEFDDEFLGKKASGSRKRKAKRNSPKTKKEGPAQMNLSSSGYAEDDDDLMKAIALSLQDSAGGSSMGHDGKKENAEDTGRKKRKKPFTSRVQMTEDELVIHFYQFDEAGKGSISIRDLRKIAIAHDFTWTDKELADMIHCFDSDGDGKLNLDDFRKIVNRCNMLRGCVNF